MKASEALSAPLELSSEAGGGAAHKSYQQITGWQVGYQNPVSRQACQDLALHEKTERCRACGILIVGSLSDIVCARSASRVQVILLCVRLSTRTYTQRALCRSMI